jgi:molybdate transport system substrate-binding protein
MLRRIAVSMICAVFAVLPARAEEALVAVAANFAEVLQDLKPMFERASGHKLQSTTGSTGKLYAQIKEGAPFHVLLSADANTPERMETEKIAVAGSRFTYAIGKLALWSADAGRIGSDGTAALKASDVRHIAIANPDLAPYGVAARETLQSLGLWDLLKPKIVMGQNIGQTHSMVATGNAQLGFVALSAVLGGRDSTKGSRWDVPQSHFTPIRQDAVLLRAGARNAAAIAFLAFLRTPEARAVIDRYGYGIE